MTDPTNLVERLQNVAAGLGCPLDRREARDAAAAILERDAEIERLTALTSPSTPAGDGMVEVVQADRQNAADYGRATHAISSGEVKRLLAGEWDDLPRVQWFARHPLQALAPATVEAKFEDAAYSAYADHVAAAEAIQTFAARALKADRLDQGEEG